MAPLSPKLTLLMGNMDRYLIHDYWDHPSRQPKQYLNKFSRFCTDDRRVSLHFTMGRPFPSPQNCLFPWRSEPHLIHGSLGQPESWIQMASELAQPLLQGSLV